MTALVVLVVLGLTFFVGLLLGQEMNRRALNDQHRRVVVLSREREDLVQLLARLDDRRRPR